MFEAELLSVQELAFEVADARPELWILNRVVTPAAVSLISNDRMLQPREMDADLMRPSRLQLNVQQRESIERLPHTIQRQRIAPATYHRHARPVRRIARQWLIDL